jgi:hypothetical protein
MTKFKVGQKVRIANGVTGNEYLIEEIKSHPSHKPYKINKNWWLRESELEPIQTEVFQPGDIVRAEKGDYIAQNKVEEYKNVLWLDGSSITNWEARGYTLTLVKRPEPEIVLPTKPYAVIKSEDDVYILTKLGWVNAATLHRVGTEDLKVSLGFVDDWKVAFAGEGENE